jgi:hypothetical protein
MIYMMYSSKLHDTITQSATSTISRACFGCTCAESGEGSVCVKHASEKLPSVIGASAIMS